MKIYKGTAAVTAVAIAPVSYTHLNSYVTAICGLTGLSVSSSVPAMSVDMLGALLNLPVLRYAVTAVSYTHLSKPAMVMSALG